MIRRELCKTPIAAHSILSENKLEYFKHMRVKQARVFLFVQLLDFYKKTGNLRLYYSFYGAE